MGKDSIQIRAKKEALSREKINEQRLREQIASEFGLPAKYRIAREQLRQK